MKNLPKLTLSNKILRAIWNLVWICFFRCSPRPLHIWRVFILRLFGARIEHNVKVYQSVRIWAPWNLYMEEGSCLGDYVDCYSVEKVHLGKRAIVSQYSFLCTASHDYTIRSRPLSAAPICIGADAWVAADVFIGPGVSIGDGVVVGARSTILKSVSPWVVIVGSPAKVIKNRALQKD